jgi:O-methyltransferase
VPGAFVLDLKKRNRVIIMINYVKAQAKRLYMRSFYTNPNASTISLPQRGMDTCKRPFSKRKLQAQFHEMKDEVFWEIVPEVYDCTQLTMEPLWSLYEAVRHIVVKGIKGDIVECGVLFGGAAMLTARTLLSLKDTSRNIWLYDSFSGFVGEESIDDKTWYGDDVKGLIPEFLAIAERNMTAVGYPRERIKFVKGDIEKTAPANNNKEIALLRLDTDTYHSTKVELQYFYPKLVPGGVLIIDDYGHAFGARRATDEYFNDPADRVLLHRVNFTNRIGLKT